MDGNIKAIIVTNVVRLLPGLINYMINRNKENSSIPEPPRIEDYLSDKIQLYDIASEKTPDVVEGEFKVIQEEEQAVPASLPQPTSVSLSQTSLPPTPESNSETGTACLPCTTSHFNTTWTLLNEASRMAKGGQPMDGDEVMERVRKAEGELNAWEREDITPEKYAALDDDAKVLIDKVLPKVRNLRHTIEESGLSYGVGSVETLRKVTILAGNIDKEFRKDMSNYLKKRAEHKEKHQKIVDLARQVKSGSINKEEAKQKLQTMMEENYES